MSQDNADLGEKALSKVAEMGIKSQLDEVEDINVDVKTDPLKAMQGQVDAVSIQGKGMVMQEDLRVEKMRLETDSIAINPLKLAIGQIELTHPTEAKAQVILTEVDINRAFNSDYLHQKLQENLKITVDGKPVTLDAQKIEFRLPEDNKIFLEAQIVWPETGENREIAFTAEPHISSDHQQVKLDHIEYTKGEDLSSEVTDALLKQTHDLLDLSNFELEGMQLYLTELKVSPGKMTLICQAQIENFNSN
ncbi:LmeA family phospholipid-binding protein [Gloeothece verrucosa]|uniref:DUF2993 domain-containing protein n=1 Tax=Gloeothece verrucosa (strain PCC 7822) TaxID=497965 RepID=E0U5A2_GLOV7|nr:DUF2993 domain-containing protein [Gloeothece verrucosa]ADN13492.1 conserved hypothetical protein [Gloeothece verrucosa PCC 7822]